MHVSLWTLVLDKTALSWNSVKTAETLDIWLRFSSEAHRCWTEIHFIASVLQRYQGSQKCMDIKSTNAAGGLQMCTAQS
jgi:hypothetical protein